MSQVGTDAKEKAAREFNSNVAQPRPAAAGKGAAAAPAKAPAVGAKKTGKRLI